MGHRTAAPPAPTSSRAGGPGASQAEGLHAPTFLHAAAELQQLHRPLQPGQEPSAALLHHPTALGQGEIPPQPPTGRQHSPCFPGTPLELPPRAFLWLPESAVRPRGGAGSRGEEPSRPTYVGRGPGWSPARLRLQLPPPPGPGPSPRRLPVRGNLPRALGVGCPGVLAAGVQDKST